MIYNPAASANSHDLQGVHGQQGEIITTIRHSGSHTINIAVIQTK